MGGNNQYEDSLHIDLYSVMHDLCKNLWIILLGAISFVIIIFTYDNAIRALRFTTSTTFAVSMKNGTTAYNNLRNANGMASALAEVFESEQFKEKVLEGTGFDPDDIVIAAGVLNNTNLIEVSVEAGSAKQAFQAMRAVQTNYGSISDYIFSNASLDALDTATMPDGSSNLDNIVRHMVYAGVLAVFLFSAVIVLMSVLRDTVKNPKSLRDKVDSKLLGTIYYERKNRTLRSKMKKTNKALLITNPVSSFHFTESYHKIRMKLEYLMEEKGYKKLLVTSVQENEGKSTVAVNIALSLAQKGYKVLLIDGDLWKPAQYKIFDLKKTRVRGFGRMLQGQGELKDVLYYDKNKNLYEIFETKAIPNSAELLASDAMKKLLQDVESLMDYIIIDTAPMMLVSDAEVLGGMVDASLMVIRQDRSMTEQINDCIDVLRESGSEYLGCIFNNVHTYSYGGRHE